MKFTTLNEYFFKLQNRLYLLVLAPLLAFIYLFVYAAGSPDMIEKKPILIMACVLLVALVDWLAASVLFYKGLVKARAETELRLKLEQYYSITIIRFSLGSIAFLILAFGFHLTSHSIFSALFSVGLVFFFALWPRPAKVCVDLKLKGNEKQIVLHKNHVTSLPKPSISND